MISTPSPATSSNSSRVDPLTDAAGVTPRDPADPPVRPPSFNRRRQAAIWALLPALLAAGAAQAQQAVQLDEITVSAPRMETPLSRVPGAVGVVDEERIQRARQGLGLDESLVNIPGVFMQNRYNFAQDLRVSIRGFGARAPFGIRGVKILVDGIPATLPDGQASVDAIDLGSISRMEVLRGSASSLYGNAAGGVIDITTGSTPPVPFVEGGVAAGGHGFRRGAVKTGGLHGNLGYSATITDLHYDGYRAHSGMESTKLNARFQYALDENADVTLIARTVDAPLARDPGALTSAEVKAGRRQAAPANLRFNAGEELDEQQVGVVYRQGFGGDHELRLRGYSVWREFANRLPFESGGQVAFDRNFAGTGVLYTYVAPLLGLDNRLLLGMDLDRQRDDRQRYDNVRGSRGDRVFDQLETVSSFGAFAQNELDVTDRLTLTAGIRRDRVRFEVDDRFGRDGTDQSGDRTLSELSPKLGAVWYLSPRLIPYANVSRSFETPTTTELARCEAGGFVEDLDAQEAVTYEIGANGQLTPRLRYSAAMFHTRGRDEIISRGCPGQPGRDFFVNAGRTTRNGIELGLDAELTRRWTASLAYTFSDFEFDRFRTGGESFDGRTIPGIPRHVLYVEAGYRHESGWFAAVDALFTGELFADNANSVENGDSFVLDSRVGYTRHAGSWEIEGYLGVNNILDEAYNGNVRINAFGGRYFEPAPERNGYAGLRVRRQFGPERRR